MQILSFNSDKACKASLMQIEKNAGQDSPHHSDSSSFSSDTTDANNANGEKIELQSELFFIFPILALLSQRL